MGHQHWHSPQLGCSRTMNADIALGGNKAHWSHQHDPSGSIRVASGRRSRLRTSVWLSIVTQARDSNTVPGCCRTTESTRTSSFNMARDRGRWIPKWPFCRGSIQKNEPFFVLDILSWLRTRAIVWLDSVFWGYVGVTAPGCCTPPCWPSVAMTQAPPSVAALSHNYHHHWVSSSAFLHCSPLHFSIFPTSSSQICLS